MEVPEDVFLDEIDFYRLDEEAVMEYKLREGICLEEEPMPLPKRPWQRIIWQLFEDPNRYSSNCNLLLNHVFVLAHSYDE